MVSKFNYRTVSYLPGMSATIAHLDYHAMLVIKVLQRLHNLPLLEAFMVCSGTMILGEKHSGQF